MIRNYYTLKKVCRELQNLSDFYITECFTQEKDILAIQCEKGSKTEFIIINCESNDSSAYIRTKFARAKKNTLDIFDNIIGLKIKSVAMIDGERTIVFDLGITKLIANLFGGAKSSIFLFDKNNLITDSFKSKSQFVGTNLEIDFSKLLINDNSEINEVSEDFKKLNPNESLINALSKSKLNIGKYYSKEILSRIGLDNDIKLSELTEANFEEINIEVKKLLNEINSSNEFYIGITKKKELLLSLIKLEEFNEIIDVYKEISYAIYKRIINKSQRKSFELYYLDLYRKLSSKKKRLEQLIKETENIKLSLERASKYKLWAESLLYGEDLKTTGLECIDRELWDGEIIKISLDKGLSIAENANKYFEKAKKTSEEAKSREKLKVKLFSELEKINLIIDELNKINDTKELDKIKAKMSEDFNINSGAKSENAKKYREFDIGEGYTLYVGKNAANNDELTCRFAKPNDIWLHARSVGGSHGVIRVGGEKKPSKKTIEKAGMIIAYYSQAKHGKFVPVSYTLKKYVNKPRGSNPGSVTISREEVVMVEPKLWTPELE